jgi:hypothetical protein
MDVNGYRFVRYLRLWQCIGGVWHKFKRLSEYYFARNTLIYMGMRLFRDEATDSGVRKFLWEIRIP